MRLDTISQSKTLAPGPEATPDRWTRPALLNLVVLIAFIVRMAWIVLGRTYEYLQVAEHYDFGYETGSIARSIASGHGFASPFRGDSGPSAWIPPLYTYFVAGIFKLFGIYSNSSALVLLWTNAVLAALTCIPIFFIGRRLGGDRVGMASAWLYALVPAFMQWDIHWVWETTLTTFLLSTLFWISLHIAGRRKVMEWAGYGALWGITALTNPAVLTFLPIALGYPLWLRRQRAQAWLRYAVVSVLVFTALLVPWTVRNYLVFGKFILIRDNLPAELSFGNSDFSRAVYNGWAHPSVNPVENRKYKTMGELKYIDWKKTQALSFIHRHPVIYADYCFRRVYYFWDGFGGWDESWGEHIRIGAWILFALFSWIGLFEMSRKGVKYVPLITGLFLLYPLPYYFTLAYSRFKHPIEPIMLICCVFALAQTDRLKRFFSTPELQKTAADPTA